MRRICIVVLSVLAVLCMIGVRVAGVHMTEGEIFVAFWPWHLWLVAAAAAIMWLGSKSMEKEGEQDK
jgi:hypothetical protein